MIWAVAIVTMIFGALVAIVQTDVKRMLATPRSPRRVHPGGPVGDQPEGPVGHVFYLATYGFSTLAAFAIVGLVRDGGRRGHPPVAVGRLGRRSPVVAGTFALLLLAFAGIPLTSGFAGSSRCSRRPCRPGHPTGRGRCAVSAIAAFFYVRVIVLMFFSAPVSDGPRVVVPSPMTTVAVALGVAVTVVLGVAPQPVLDLANNAAYFVH